MDPGGRGPRRSAVRQLATAASAHVLEAALVRAALGDGEASGTSLLVVPTRLLADRVEAALADAAGPDGVAAGISVHHHRSLAEELLDLAHVLGLTGGPPLRIASDLEMEQLVAAALRDVEEPSELRTFAEERPRALAGLRSSLAELRDACVAPDELEAAGAPGLGELLRAVERRLASAVRAAGVTDRAGHALAAAEAARRLGERMPWTRAVHHGSYALVASQAELVAAIAESVPLRVLAPCVDGPAGAAARRALGSWAGDRLETLDAEGEESPLFDVSAAFAEEACPAPPTAAGALRLEVASCRGAAAEIDLAARLVAEAHLDRGVPLEDVAVVARTLEPFAGHLAEAFDAHGIPYRTHAGLPVVREPWPRAALSLLRVLTDDLPRDELVELLRSPWFRFERADVERADVVPDLWDTWTRAARVVQGAGAYAEDLLTWHESDLAEREQRSGEAIERDAPWVLARLRRLRALAAIAARLGEDRSAWRQRGGLAAHADFVRELLSSWLRPPADRDSDRRAALARGREAVLAAVDTLEALAGIADEPAGPRRVRELLEQALARASLPLGTGDGSGVRVVDAMQARGLPVRELVLIGFNQGSLPRKPRQDPFLPDAVRAHLRNRFERPVELKGEGREEERLLLALTLAAATERVTVTWQRADEEGRARAVSPFLRELARLATGRPRPVLLLGEEGDPPPGVRITRLSAHPARAAEQLRERSGRSAWRDAVLEVSGRPQRHADLLKLAGATGRGGPGLSDGLDALRVVDAFTLARLPDRAAALRRDGLLGPGVAPEPRGLSASALETLGRCPLQWFFKHALRIEPLEEQADELELEAREVGSLVHRVLELTYLRAVEEGGTPEVLRAPETAAGLRETWRSELRRFAGARWERSPVYWEALRDRWEAVLVDFLARDAARLRGEDGRVRSVERGIEAELALRPGGRPFRLVGRTDRVVATRAGTRIEDYKASRDVGRRVDVKDVLRGLQLQGLAYLLAGRESARVRGDDAPVRVAFLAVHPEADPDGAFAELSFRSPAVEEGALETVAVLAGLLEAGRFPLRPEPRRCHFCDYRSACRRSHPATEARLAEVRELEDHRLLGEKSTRNPLLAALRQDGGAGD